MRMHEAYWEAFGDIVSGMEDTKTFFHVRSVLFPVCDRLIQVSSSPGFPYLHLTGFCVAGCTLRFLTMSSKVRDTLERQRISGFELD